MSAAPSTPPMPKPRRARRWPRALLLSALAFVVVLVGYGWAAGAGSLEATERLLVRLGARIVGSVGLGFGTDLETDGTLHVTEPVTEALGTALTELASAVQETPAA